MTDRKYSAVVIGDGWAALASVGFLLSALPQEAEGADAPAICWISGSGNRLLPVLPSVEAGEAARAWQELAGRYGVEVEASGETEGTEGVYVREFRNKSFRAPAWAKSESDEHAQELVDENLGGPERRVVAVPECRFDLDLLQIEEQVRRRVLGDSRVVRRGGVPVVEVKFDEEPGEDVAAPRCSIVLASGEEIACDRIIYADRWSSIRAIRGMPETLKGRSGAKLKTLEIGRKFRPHGALQVIFTHDVPVGAEMIDGFFSSAPKEAGESVDRHIWGYFFELQREAAAAPEDQDTGSEETALVQSGARRRRSKSAAKSAATPESSASTYELNLSAVLKPGSEGGMRSIWTFFLEPEETDDNHLIAKKLRRIKQTLNRTFAAGGWLPEGKSEFTATVVGEHVRFQEAVVFAEGERVAEPLFAVRSIKGRRSGEAADEPVAFVTDGFGPSCALKQVTRLFGVGTEASATESEDSTEAEDSRSGETAGPHDRHDHHGPREAGRDAPPDSTHVSQ